MTQYAMVIDLQKCCGCGACAIACKTENNTQNRQDGQSFNWAGFLYEEEGLFPNVMHTTRPVLCNHCTDAPCVGACPVEALFKTPDGITMINHERCIGDRACQRECPYSKENVEIGEWSVLSFNEPKKDTHPFYRDRSEIIAAGTASGAEVAKQAKSIPPHRNRYGHPDYSDARRAGVVEKCIFCDHRVKKGEMPYCVVSCPSGGRIFGDIKDPKSEPAILLTKYKAAVLKPEEGTSPNVFYIRSFKVQG
ncbi:MAG TPA: 4Fe-4S ferredoxin [Deltaproteobacteria bacterium]|nr:MAG: 4Fe-4S ferredoxin [Deltaproteobacteria bacterium GWC2_65_14]HBO70764.1 4Fe-4S ferredoxin [Deltaproteobacteria bacterium]